MDVEYLGLPECFTVLGGYLFGRLFVSLCSVLVGVLSIGVYH